jgi:NAD(P)-dependent dehydrogenase (short-subunit alcohol dehydrogenase family)
MSDPGTASDVLDRFDMAGRVVIVTGGSRGIGRAVSTGLAAVGARVVVASRKAEACAAVVDDIEAAGGTAVAVPTHMGDLDAVAGLVERTVERFGTIDVVVNNAANPLALPIGSITPEALAKSHEVNVRGPVFLVQHALPWLRGSGHAAVVNVLTAGIYTSAAYVSMYVAAKSAMLAMTRAMAAELAGDGIRVNALAPGTVATDMVFNVGEAAQAMMVDAQLMKRMADPAEMVAPVLFLASDASSFMTGQVLVVDGGMTTH